MAEGLNKAMLMGNLGADPELRITGNGTAVINLRLATTRTWKDEKKGKQEQTEWHNVIVWGTRAEALSKILSKGSRILVEGRIQTSSYDKNGEKRYKTEIVAENILLQGGGERRGEEPKAVQQHRDGDAFNDEPDF